MQQSFSALRIVVTLTLNSYLIRSSEIIQAFLFVCLFLLLCFVLVFVFVFGTQPDLFS